MNRLRRALLLAAYALVVQDLAALAEGRPFYAETAEHVGLRLDYLESLR